VYSKEYTHSTWPFRPQATSWCASLNFLSLLPKTGKGNSNRPHVEAPSQAVCSAAAEKGLSARRCAAECCRRRRDAVVVPLLRTAQVTSKLKPCLLLSGSICAKLDDLMVKQSKSKEKQAACGGGGSATAADDDAFALSPKLLKGGKIEDQGKGKKAPVAKPKASAKPKKAPIKPKPSTRSASATVGPAGVAKPKASAEPKKAPIKPKPSTRSASATVGPAGVRKQKRTTRCKNKTCSHGVYQYLCRKCPGKGICSHRKERRRCEVCVGHRTTRRKMKTCSHGVQQYLCRKCPGKGICSHRKERRRCEVCVGPAGVPKKKKCTHGVDQYMCRQCPGKGICSHGKDKRWCEVCVGPAGFPKQKYKTGNPNGVTRSYMRRIGKFVSASPERESIYSFHSTPRTSRSGTPRNTSVSPPPQRAKRVKRVGKWAIVDSSDDDIVIDFDEE
jgi:hypothetical protein